MTEKVNFALAGVLRAASNSKLIPNIRNNVGFGYVSSATNFSSSLVPCHAGNGHSFQTENLCSFLAKPNVISDIWYQLGDVGRSSSKLIEEQFYKTIG